MLLVVGVIAGFVYVLVCTAWQCDDAFIAFRTAQNFWHGKGLVWNPGERVQAYTSPLWLMISVVCYGLFREVYFSMLAVSMLLSLVCVFIIGLRTSTNRVVSILTVIALSASASVIDYSTSGLENPLLSLLLVLFVIRVKELRTQKSLAYLSFLAALVGLVRLDALLLVLPALAWTAWQGRINLKSFLYMILGFSPLILWEMFSLVYYGSFVPNTAYAKLNIEIPRLALYKQGLSYFVDSLTHDPITLSIIAMGVIAGICKGKSATRFIVFGIFLYFLYLIRIGGDFMSGRFFSSVCYACAAMFVGHCELIRLSFLRDKARPFLLGIAASGLVLYGFLFPSSRWLSDADYGKGMGNGSAVSPTGIADERAFYYPRTGLLNIWKYWPEIKQKNLPIPPHPWAVHGRKFSQSNKMIIITAIGFVGYFTGPDKHIIDVGALGDPFLSRLPFRPIPGVKWRVGHYERLIPEGYIETRMTGIDSFSNRDLVQLYNAVQNVTTGPLFSTGRWREIWRLHTGHYDNLLDS